MVKVLNSNLDWVIINLLFLIINGSKQSTTLVCFEKDTYM